MQAVGLLAKATEARLTARVETRRLAAGYFCHAAERAAALDALWQGALRCTWRIGRASGARHTRVTLPNI